MPHCWKSHVKAQLFFQEYGYEYGYSCGHVALPSAGVFYYILQNDIGSYVSTILVNGFDFGKYSGELS